MRRRGCELESLSLCGLPACGARPLPFATLTEVIYVVAIQMQTGSRRQGQAAGLEDLGLVLQLVHQLVDVLHLGKANKGTKWG